MQPLYSVENLHFPLVFVDDSLNNGMSGLSINALVSSSRCQLLGILCHLILTMSMDLREFDCEIVGKVDKCIPEHETRHNTNRALESPEVENVESPEENTPLLHRFQPTVPERTTLTTVIVSLLLIILIAGVFIGIYLLVIQNDSENILPPVENPLTLVSRSQWDPSNTDQSVLRSFPYRLRAVTVVHTGTDECNSTETCTKLLLEMQSNTSAANGTLRYNFLISSNGQTYEDLGWLKCLPQQTKNTMPTGLLLAFIGNFTETPPTRRQLQEAKNFFAASESQQYLHPSYRIYGKNINETPPLLGQSLKIFPQWSNEFSDKK